MVELVATLPDWVLAGDAYEDHHGGAVWVKDATGWLAFARVAMGYPLFIAAVAFSFWIVRRARGRLVASAGEHGPA